MCNVVFVQQLQSHIRLSVCARIADRFARIVEIRSPHTIAFSLDGVDFRLHCTVSMTFSVALVYVAFT